MFTPKNEVKAEEDLNLQANVDGNLEIKVTNGTMGNVYEVSFNYPANIKGNLILGWFDAILRDGYNYFYLDRYSVYADDKPVVEKYGIPMGVVSFALSSEYIKQEKHYGRYLNAPDYSVKEYWKTISLPSAALAGKKITVRFYEGTTNVAAYKPADKIASMNSYGENWNMYNFSLIRNENKGFSFDNASVQEVRKAHNEDMVSPENEWIHLADLDARSMEMYDGELLGDVSIYTSLDGKHLIREFAKRLYTEALNRNADPKGLAYWTDALAERTKTAADAVKGFFLSDEFMNKNLRDEEVVERCYKTMLNREADVQGKAYWLKRMQEGNGVLEVLQGFVDSKEFTKLCEDYNVTKGKIVHVIATKKISQFIERLYTKALGRKSDPSGLEYWSNRITKAANQRQEAYVAATDGFFHSNEFLNRNMKNDEFIRILYRTFLNREAEPVGYGYWLGQLSANKTRDEVIKGFAQSKEFNALLDSYGLR